MSLQAPKMYFETKLRCKDTHACKLMCSLKQEDSDSTNGAKEFSHICRWWSEWKADGKNYFSCSTRNTSWHCEPEFLGDCLVFSGWNRGLGSWRLTHTPRLGSTPLGVGLAGESGISFQPVASLTAHLTLRPVGGTATIALEEAMQGPSEGRAGAYCRPEKINMRQAMFSKIHFLVFFMVYFSSTSFKLLVFHLLQALLSGFENWNITATKKGSPWVIKKAV